MIKWACMDTWANLALKYNKNIRKFMAYHFCINKGSFAFLNYVYALQPSLHDLKTNDFIQFELANLFVCHE